MTNHQLLRKYGFSPIDFELLVKCDEYLLVRAKRSGKVYEYLLGA